MQVQEALTQLILGNLIWEVSFCLNFTEPNNMFQRRSDMFSFNGENINSIRSFLSSKKSSNSLGEDLSSSKYLRVKFRHSSKKEKETPTETESKNKILK